MTPEESQQFEAMKMRISVLEAESAGLQMAVIALIANHPSQRNFHLYLTSLLETQAAAAEGSKGLLKFLSSDQKEAARALVEHLGSVPENKA